jgi:hypothetical protein
MLETYIEYGEFSAHIMFISCFACLGSASCLGRPSLRGCKWSAGGRLIARFSDGDITFDCDTWANILVPGRFCLVGISLVLMPAFFIMVATLSIYPWATNNSSVDFSYTSLGLK